MFHKTGGNMLGAASCPNEGLGAGSLSPYKEDLTLGDYIKRKEEVPCKTHPDSPHGFCRNESHSLNRYVCECEFWEPPKNKLTFEKWWNEIVYTGKPRKYEFNCTESTAQVIWKAAQENM